MRGTERVTVTMPADQAAKLRRLVAAGGADSVSSYVSEAVRARMAREEALAALERRFGRPPDAALRWARDRLRPGQPAAS